jgi:protocatechuate 3,4-dioxygenase beta subunit
MSDTLLKILGLSLVACICLIGQNTAAQELLTRTPPDYEGPFYPVTKQQDEDNDLTRVAGRDGIADGDILNLAGVILNTMGEPQEGVTIEIWQTDPQGKYLHPGDSTPGKRDPDFQYWGRDISDANGSFSFKTILPGAYHPRPAHIHYKLWLNGKNILTSQIYFKNFLHETGNPSLTGQVDSQTVEPARIREGVFKAFFRIVL